MWRKRRATRKTRGPFVCVRQAVVPPTARCMEKILPWPTWPSRSRFARRCSSGRMPRPASPSAPAYLLQMLPVSGRLLHRGFSLADLPPTCLSPTCPPPALPHRPSRRSPKNFCQARHWPSASPRSTAGEHHVRGLEMPREEWKCRLVGRLESMTRGGWTCRTPRSTAGEHVARGLEMPREGWKCRLVGRLESMTRGGWRACRTACAPRAASRRRA